MTNPLTYEEQVAEAVADYRDDVGRELHPDEVDQIKIAVGESYEEAV